MGPSACTGAPEVRLAARTKAAAPSTLAEGRGIDTVRDKIIVDETWTRCGAPWKVW